MTFWSVRNIRAVTGGSWLRKPEDGSAEAIVRGLSTDTRCVKPGEVFLALRGDRFDAHEFLGAAASAGAGLLIVDRPDCVPHSLLQSSSGPPVLRVADGRKALGQLAAAYRRSLEGTRIIAVVGSNGKTTTSKLIHSVLSTKFRGSVSPKSFNNDIGVPLTILAAKPGDQFLICEVGSNHPGETSRLARIVQPDIAVVTSVGRDHVEFFATLADVAREHAAIFADLEPGGTAIVPDHDESMAEWVRPLPSVVRFGHGPRADVRISAVAHARLASGALGLRFQIGERARFEMPLIGGHNAMNAAAAYAVARRLGMNDAEIARGLAAASPPEMRLNHRTIAGIDLLIDCYNANPDSMLAAFEAFAEVSADAPRRVMVLGDMLEMGERSHDLHEEIGRAIADSPRPPSPPPELLIAVGPASRHLAAAASVRCRTIEFPDLDGDRAVLAAQLLEPGDFVLIKASRGMKLERLVAALEQSSCTAAHDPSLALRA